MGVTPHVAQYPETDRRGSAIDGRTTRHAGYALSQRKRKLVEQAFGWMKTIGRCASFTIVAGLSSIGTLPSLPPHTTWFAFARCWRNPCDEARSGREWTHERRARTPSPRAT